MMMCLRRSAPRSLALSLSLSLYGVMSRMSLSLIRFHSGPSHARRLPPTSVPPQVLALFSRAEIQWPPLMRSMFTFFSAFNFNIDITAPECLIPNLDYKLKWWFIMLIPLAAFSFLCLAFVFEIIRDKCSGVTKLHIGRKFGKVIAHSKWLI